MSQSIDLENISISMSDLDGFDMDISSLTGDVIDTLAPEPCNASVEDINNDRTEVLRGIVTLFFEEDIDSLALWALDPESYFNDAKDCIKEWVGQ